MFEDRVVGDYKTGVSTSTAIHEFGHYFGLVDYYDNDSGHNVLGVYDMMSNNEGDHNPYSKYLLNWISPIIVDGKQDSYEIKINAFGTSGDAILIPALGYDYNGTQFDEYIMIDLFASDSLYESTSSNYQLGTGVRIYHVNSVYEYRTYEKKDGTLGTIATIHNSASVNSKFANQGKYLIELIQNGNVNTFSGVGAASIVSSKDLFKQGDIFRVDNYNNFFYEGKMDNGMDFGYEIKVKEIVTNAEESYAIISINKIN